LDLKKESELIKKRADNLFAHLELLQ